MESLPDSLLGRIFTAVGREAGANITLVSHRWHAVFYSEPALWQSLRFDAASMRDATLRGQRQHWFAAKGALLLRVGEFVQQLDWIAEGDSDALQPAELHQLLALMPHLESWHIASLTRWIEVGGAVLNCYGVQGYCRGNGEVQQLELTRITDFIPRLHGLQLLVAAALPAGTQHSQLHSLSIRYSALPSRAVLDCPFLGHLTSLALDNCNGKRDGEAAMLDAFLQQAPQLHSLTLRGVFAEFYELWEPGELPPALVSLASLQQLTLQEVYVEQLPNGPYLHGLESLHLGDGQWYSLPPAVSAATGLTALSLDASDFDLTVADVDGVLGHLTRLRQLHMGRTHMPPDVQARLSQRAPQLQVIECPSSPSPSF